MEQRLENLIDELESFTIENWETGEFSPDLLHKALCILRDAKRGVRGESSGDSDRAGGILCRPDPSHSKYTHSH